MLYSLITDFNIDEFHYNLGQNVIFKEYNQQNIIVKKTQMGHCQNITIHQIWQTKMPKNRQESSSKTFTKTVIIEDNQEFDEWVFCLKSMAKNAPFKLMLLPLQNQFPKKSSVLCGQQNTIELRFGEYYYTLSQKVKLNKIAHKNFPENEIWYLIYVVIKVSRYLERLGKKIINLGPQHIIFNSIDEVKIINCLSSPDNFHIYKQQRLQQSIGSSLCGNQLFNIAILFIEITSRQRLLDIYSFDKIIDSKIKNIIQDALKKTSINYSQMLTQTLNKMANYECVSKDKYSEIWKILEKFETQILAKQFKGEISMRNSAITNPKISGIFNSPNLFKSSSVCPEDLKNQTHNRYTQPYDYHKIE